MGCLYPYLCKLSVDAECFCLSLMYRMLTCYILMESSAQEKPCPFISLWAFFKPEILFLPFHNIFKCPEQSTSPGCFSFSLHISTPASMKSDWSQGSMPIAQVPSGKCCSYLLFKRITPLLHTAMFPIKPQLNAMIFP